MKRAKYFGILVSLLGGVTSGTEPIYDSGVVTSTTAGHAVETDVKLGERERIYLVVSDAGDGFSCDWAGWLEQKFVGQSGELRLSEMMWREASTGRGQVNVGRDAGGGALVVGGERFVDGIGVHANLILEYRVPKGASFDRSVAKAGLDDSGVGEKDGAAASVRFQVFTEAPRGGSPKADLVPAELFSVPEGLETARMRADGSHVRIVGHSYRNSYEQTVTSSGDVFQNDNDDPPACRVSFLMDYGNAGFSSSDGMRSWRADRCPGQDIPTAGWRQDDPETMPSGDICAGGVPTGVAFFENGALGAEFVGTHLTCEAGRNVVLGFQPEIDGAGFKLERGDFLTSDPSGEFAGSDFLGGAKRVRSDLKTFFRPSDVVVGADGVAYVSDWFDPRVRGHQDLEESLSGAICRMAPKGFNPVVPEFDLETSEGQIVAVRSLMCDVVGETGIDYGAALTDFGITQPANVIDSSMLEPSLDISQGYDGGVLTTDGDTEIHGAPIADGDPWVVKSMGGGPQTISKARVKKRRKLGESLMVSAGQLGMTA